MLNKFFKQYQGQTNEAKLFQSLTTESIQIKGIDIYYIKRDVVEIDELFNENSNARFTEGIAIEAYIENFEGFSGSENDLISKFGLELNDELKIVLSKERVNEELDLDNPREGDLIYLPLSDTLFEIKYTDKEDPFYSLGDIRSFKVTAEIFDYSGEDFETGLEELDGLDEDFLNSNATEENDIFDEIDDEIVDFTENNVFGAFGSNNSE